MSVVGVALVVVFEVNNEEEEEEEEEAFVLSVFWPSSNCLRGESLEDSVGSAIVRGCVVWCGEQGFLSVRRRPLEWCKYYGRSKLEKKKNRIYQVYGQNRTHLFYNLDQFRKRT